MSLYLPNLEAWLFTAKSFAAAMLAFAIALAVGLDRPYWAMATVYIVVHPLSGAVRSKAVYRLAGTLAGAAATIALVPNLANAPEVLTVALAAWIGICLYLAVLDRTPRGYAFMLAGYTAAIIGFPVVTAPDAVWDVAISRVEEICLGVACATLVSSIVLPRPVAPALRARLIAWRLSARALALEALAPHDTVSDAAGGATLPARLRLAADAVEIRNLTTHIAYDTSDLHRATPLLFALERRLLLMLPVFAAVRDRVADLHAIGGLTPPVRALMQRLHDWIEADVDTVTPAEAASLRADIARLEDDAAGDRDWAGMLRGTLLSRFAEVVDLRQDFLDLRRAIFAPGGPARMPKLAVDLPGPPRIHRDHGVAALRGLVVALVMLVICTFWIASGWPDGSQAALLAAIACCFTAGQDDPVPSLKGLLIAVLLASVFAAIGQFAVLPDATNFEMLTLAMAGFFIPAGLLAVVPATQKLGALPIFTATLLALQGSYSADFAAWGNGTAAVLLGVFIALAVSAIAVPAGALFTLRRRLRAGWADLAAAARSSSSAERLRLAELFLDRMGLIAPLLAVSPRDEQAVSVAAMRDLRVGINLVDLRALWTQMPPLLRHSVDAVLHRTERHYTACATLGRAIPPPDRLLAAIDRALDDTLETDSQVARGAMRALVGMRRTLFAAAPAYDPAVPRLESKAGAPPLDPAGQGPDPTLKQSGPGPARRGLGAEPPPFLNGQNLRPLV
jgi:uncharacterized membrane protein YccC